MSISADLLKKEGLRSHLFGETWRTLIPAVFRDVPTYYDKGNAVASLGNCSRWSTTFATAIQRHLPHGAKILDVCSGTHDIPLRLFAIDPTLEIYTVDGSMHMTAEGQRRARERNLAIHAHVCDAHSLPFADNSFDANKDCHRKEKGCDLIVMASHGRSRNAATVLGGVTAKVMTHTTIPLLVCR